MKKYFVLVTLALLSISSCEDDDTLSNPVLSPEIVVPVEYTFSRDGVSTVNFPGQTERIQMAEELIAAMNGFDTTTEQLLLDMYANENAPFVNNDLNNSSRSIRSKVAVSEDLFNGNSAASAGIQQFFADLMAAQIDEVFPAVQVAAQEGVAGQIADGSSTRYVNAQGLEYNQAVTKSLIGALMVDQTINNYLSTSLLDAGTNREDNDNDVPRNDNGTDTQMEHLWDEAYGYAYGTATNTANPNATIGNDDSFLSKYIGRVEDDVDFAGIASNIFDAYKLGRAAIVAKDYEVRDEQAAILKELLSQVIGIRSVYYLQQGRMNIENNDLGGAFHDLSEGYGFIYSLQFTRNPVTDAPYFTNEEVIGYLNQITAGNGFWEVTPTTLDTIAEEIAGRFVFTREQAATLD